MKSILIWLIPFGEDRIYARTEKRGFKRKLFVKDSSINFQNVQPELAFGRIEPSCWGDTIRDELKHAHISILPSMANMNVRMR